MRWVDRQLDSTCGGGELTRRSGTISKELWLAIIISVLVFRRDYMCAMESVSLPTRSVHYSPGVYRFMTNVAVYALTHGSISDYSGYVPEDTMAKKILPTRPPEAVGIGAVE